MPSKKLEKLSKRMEAAQLFIKRYEESSSLEQAAQRNSMTVVQLRNRIAYYRAQGVKNLKKFPRVAVTQVDFKALNQYVKTLDRTAETKPTEISHQVPVAA